MTAIADETNIAAIRSPTAMSGHAEPVIPTPAAANSTPGVRQHVVPRAQPRRAHVDVVEPPPPKQHEADQVGGEGQQANTAHHLGSGHDVPHYLVDDLGEHAQAEGRHQRALEEGGARLPVDAPPDHVEAEAVDDRVAEHVDRIGQQRGRPGREARAALGHEHGRVDPQDQKQEPALAARDVGGDGAAALHASYSWTIWISMPPPSIRLD
jgi:hypothetical protein